jgi:hypothetical protein
MDNKWKIVQANRKGLLVRCLAIVALIAVVVFSARILKSSPASGSNQPVNVRTDHHSYDPIDSLHESYVEGRDSALTNSHSPRGR